MSVTKKRITKILFISFVAILFLAVFMLGTLGIKYTFAAPKASILHEITQLQSRLNSTDEKSALLYEYSRHSLSRSSFVLIDAQNKFYYQNNVIDIDNKTINDTRQNGTASFVRYQSSVNDFTYHNTALLNDGSILYTLTPLFGSQNQLTYIALSLAVFLILGIVLSLLLAPFLAGMILSPIYHANDEAEKFMKNRHYTPTIVADELSPLMNKIIALQNEIDRSIFVLSAEQATRQALIENISEGLILLDENQQIISINNSAKNVLFLNKHVNYETRNIFDLIQLQNLKAAIKQAIANHAATTFEDQVQDRYYKYFISPSNQNGFLIFIVDTTKEAKENIVRRDFASNVSHELKTPLTSIKGFAEMLERGMLSNADDIQKTASIIYRESNRLLFLIEDIMRLSKIENADKEKDFQIMDLSVTIGEVLEALSIIAKEKNVALVYESKPAKVYANSMMMHELFFNLIENAIKYNVENGAVTIQTKCNANKCNIIISDSGIGIPRKHLNRIFERFYRVDQSRSRDTGGTGLGLSIVKHIVEQHRGQIHLTSSENSGTTIHILLPSLS